MSIVKRLHRTADVALRIALPAMRYWKPTLYECPLCGRVGEFLTESIPRAGEHRPHAQCPRCGALEKHRLQALVLERLSGQFDLRKKRCLQIAPDPVTPLLRSICARLVTADIEPDTASIRIDLRRIDLPDASFDIVFASHVMEHIAEDDVALREIHRVLSPSGIAILPVPIYVERTVEYPRAIDTEHGHVRAPGLDYFDRYRTVFDRVIIVTSGEFPDRYQTWTYQDRTQYPNALSPFRTPMTGFRHIEAVPVCFKH